MRRLLPHADQRVRIDLQLWVSRECRVPETFDVFRLAADGGALDGRRPDQCPAFSMKNRLKALRIEKGWSQSELAARLSVSRQTVNAIENERYDPSLPLAFAIARVLERRIEDIFEE